MRVPALLFLILLLLMNTGTPCIASGPSLGQGGRKGVVTEKEKTRALERTGEERKTTGKRREERAEESASKTLQRVAREALNLRDDASLRVSVSATDILLPLILDLEKKGTEPFATCRLLSDPPRLSDLGIELEIVPGLMDVTLKEYLETRASAGAISRIDPQTTERIVTCAVRYGTIMASASLQLRHFVESVGENWVGLADLKKFAAEALRLSVSSPDPTVSSLSKRALSAFALPCRFNGRIDSFRCGGIVLDIRPALAVHLGNLSLYGDSPFGIRTEWQVSAAWSLDQAFERLASDSRTKNLVKAVSDYVEELEARGKITRASLVKKKALNLAREGRADLLLAPPF